MRRSYGKDRGARRIAWHVLWRTQQSGTYADRVLHARLRRSQSLARVDRALASELVFGTLRWQQSLDLALSRVSRRSLKRIHPKILTLLRLAAYQLLYLQSIPPSAAVNEAVESAKEEGYGHAASFINGTLREIARRGGSLLSIPKGLPPADSLSMETSHPKWMIERWLEQWGEQETKAICRANNRVPALTLRANTLRVSRDQLSESLRREGVICKPTRLSPDGLRVHQLPTPIDTLESFRRGEFQIQDEAAQLVVRWLDAGPGDSILDACAAPGGKTTYLAQMLENKSKILAADIHPGRLGLLQRECERLGIHHVETLAVDLSDPSANLGCFSRILLDAPCSGLGVIRRHPDAKWRKTPEHAQRMAKVQIKLLEALISHLQPGGSLLYSVCTHTQEETEGILEAILGKAHGVRLLTDRGGLPPAARALVGSDGIFRSFPHRHDMDGFTAFRLKKLAGPSALDGFSPR